MVTTEQIINNSQYIYMAGFWIMLFVFALTSKPTMNRLMMHWHRRKGALIEIIGADSVASEIVVKRDGYEFVWGDCHFFINPKKSVRKFGLQRFTFVMNNAIGHDFYNKPREAFKKLIQEAKTNVVIEKKISKGLLFKKTSIETKEIPDLTEEFHDIFEEPYRLDAKLVQTAMINAQLSNASIFDKLLKLLSNKNMITIAMIIGILAAAAALMGWLALDKLTNMPACKITETTANIIHV